MGTPPIDEVVWSITRGHYTSEELSTISDAIRRRKSRDGYQTLDELVVGQEVRITNIGTGAKYLNGAHARVVEIGRSRVLVQITEMRNSPAFRDGRQGRFRRGTKVYLHGQNLEPILEGTWERQQRIGGELLAARNVTDTNPFEDLDPADIGEELE
jgi:hypothetical protein